MGKKRVYMFLGCILLCAFTPVLLSQNSNNFGSFMGAGWGVSAQDFKNAFKFTSELNWKDYFYLEKFKLEDMSFERIDFLFFDKDGLKPTSTLKKSVAHLYFLNEIEIRIRAEFFDFLTQIFKFKYGSPFKVENNSENKEIRLVWVSGDKKRMIIMDRYSLEQGVSKTILAPYNQDLLLSKENRIKEIAAQL